MGKYLFDSRKHFKLNGLKEFQKPSWFNDKWSKPFEKSILGRKIRVHKLSEKLKNN